MRRGGKREMEIIFFNARVERFFKSIDRSLRPRVTRVFELLEKYGNALGMPYSKALGDGLFELRITGATHIRALYAFHRDKIWILHMFIKKTGRIARRDMEYAREQKAALAQI